MGSFVVLFYCTIIKNLSNRSSYQKLKFFINEKGFLGGFLMLSSFNFNVGREIFPFRLKKS